MWNLVAQIGFRKVSSGLSLKNLVDTIYYLPVVHPGEPFDEMVFQLVDDATAGVDADPAQVSDSDVVEVSGALVSVLDQSGLCFDGVGGDGSVDLLCHLEEVVGLELAVVEMGREGAEAEGHFEGDAVPFGRHDHVPGPPEGGQVLGVAAPAVEVPRQLDEVPAVLPLLVDLLERDDGLAGLGDCRVEASQGLVYHLVEDHGVR